MLFSALCKYIVFTWRIFIPFFVRAVEKIISGLSVGKIIIIIILSLRVGTSKNNNIDHQGKETCAYKNDHISLPLDSLMSSALNFCFITTEKKKIILEEK